MRILLTGSGGFIGRHLAAALRAAGHEVVRAGRKPDMLAVDYTRDHAAGAWLPRLAGIDCAINAVGIIREHGAQSFDSLHRAAPVALFDACAQAGVRTVIQISALGADDGAETAYHLSKKAADDHLASLDLDYVIVQPSLVYGRGGGSAALFTLLATLPLVPRLAHGMQMVQPVHVDDVVAAVLAAVEGKGERRARLPVVGPRALGLHAFLQELRGAMGMRRAWPLPVPVPLLHLTAAVGEHVPAMLFDRAAWRMLERGNTGDPAPLARLLGRQPRDPLAFIAADEAPQVRAAALLGWGAPLLTAGVALVWLWTAVVSLGLYPVAGSYALLAQAGVPDALAPVALYGAALLDLAFGAGIVLVRRRAWRRWLWRAQFATILFYMLVISVRMPGFWLHPYGPLLKNLPMLAAMLLLAALDETREPT
jgi:uncharacterized protein YbjT (DUF2867 family)